MRFPVGLLSCSRCVFNEKPWNINSKDSAALSARTLHCKIFFGSHVIYKYAINRYQNKKVSVALETNFPERSNVLYSIP